MRDGPFFMLRKIGASLSAIRADIENVRSGGHRNRKRISPLRIPGQRGHARHPADEEDRGWLR
jgi:hypothetical protein